MDTRLLFLLNHDFANALFDVLMPALSAQGYLLVLPFLFFMVAQGMQRDSARGRSYLATAFVTFLIACVAVYLSGWVEDWMKETVARIRPCRSMPDIRLLLPCPKSYSMPSGHAINSFAFAAPLVYLTRHYITRAWRLYPLLPAALIAFSRIYLGVHYPSDVLAGAFLGTGIGLALSVLYEMIGKEEIMKREK